MTEEYVGVRFKTLFEGADFGYEKERGGIVEELRRLGSRELLDRNNGNVSVRVEEGMVITPTGKDMNEVATDDLVLVRDVNEKANLVRAVGRAVPSSESMMHWLIYQSFPRAKAIVHFHDAEILRNREMFTETEKAHPYGTRELAHEALKALKKRKFILLKGHGALAVGSSLKACHTLVEKAVKSVR